MTDQRGRLTEAMVWVSATYGYAAASVRLVSTRAGVSRATFYEHFDNREACFVAALEEGFERLRKALAASCAEQDTTTGRLQATAWEAVCLIEDEPALTRMCVVEALAAGPTAIEARRRALDRLAVLVQDLSGARRPEIARALLSTGLDRLHDELTSPAARIDREELYRAVAYPCLVLTVGAERAAALTLEPPPSRSPAAAAILVRDAPVIIPGRERLTPRLVRTLAFLAAHPGAGNVELQRELGIAHASQVSRYLHRRRGKGLVVTGDRRGRHRAWSLTSNGHHVLEAMSVAR
jgi:AcrR family transcriptional regulator